MRVLLGDFAAGPAWEAWSQFAAPIKLNLVATRLSPCEAAEKASSCKALQLSCLKSKATVSILFYMCGKMSLYHSVRCIWRTGIRWQTGFGRQPKIHIISTIKHSQEHQVGAIGRSRERSHRVSPGPTSNF